MYCCGAHWVLRKHILGALGEALGGVVKGTAQNAVLEGTQKTHIREPLGKGFERGRH